MQLGNIFRTGAVIFTGIVSAARGVDGDPSHTPKQQGNYSIMLRVSETTSVITDYNSLMVKNLVDPVLPRNVISSRVGGEAYVLATVTKEGRVRSVRLARADSDDMGRSAVKAIRKWTFDNQLGRQLEVPIRVFFDPGYDPYKRP